MAQIWVEVEVLASLSDVSAMVPEAVAVVAGFQDVATMREPIEQSSGHLGVAKDSRPLGEAEVGGDGQIGPRKRCGGNIVSPQQGPALTAHRAAVRQLGSRENRTHSYPSAPGR